MSSSVARRDAGISAPSSILTPTPRSSTSMARTYPYRDQLPCRQSFATAPGLPATVAPIDRGDSPLPIGVQIVGPYLEDHTTIAFARLIEREFGGFAQPP